MHVARRSRSSIKCVYIDCPLVYNVYMMKIETVIPILAKIALLAMGVAALIVFHAVRLIIVVGFIILFRLKIK